MMHEIAAMIFKVSKPSLLFVAIYISNVSQSIYFLYRVFLSPSLDIAMKIASDIARSLAKAGEKGRYIRRKGGRRRRLLSTYLIVAFRPSVQNSRFNSINDRFFAVGRPSEREEKSLRLEATFALRDTSLKMFQGRNLALFSSFTWT